MRYGYKNLIKSISLNITLVNVNFYNVHTVGESLSIEGNSISLFTYDGGYVELFHNGYEITADNDLSSFISLNSMKNIIIKNVNFSGNLVNTEDKSFLFIKNANKVNFTGLVFKDNYASNYLIEIYQDFTKFEDDFYISISESTFGKNFINRAIYIHYISACQNIQILNNTFINNTANEIIYMYYDKDYSQRCLSSLKWSTKFQENYFISNYAKFNLVKIKKLGNVELSNNIIENNGEYINPNETIALDISQSFDAYLKQGFPSFEADLCKSLLDLESVAGLNITNMLIEYNICPLVSITKNTNFLNFEKNNFLHNSQQGNEWFVLINSEFCNAKDFIFINNTYSSIFKSLIYIEGSSKNPSCSLENIYIEKSIETISAKDITKLVISSLTVVESIESVHSIISFTVSKNSTFLLSNSNFEKTKSNFVSFKSEGNGNYLCISIDSVNISMHESETLIYMDSLLLIDKMSSISYLNILNSTTKLFSFSSLQGKLLLDNCVFTNISIQFENFIEVSGNNELVIKNSLFKKNLMKSIINISSNKNNTFLRVEDSNFIQNQGIVIYMLYSTAEIIRTNFYDNIDDYGSVAYLTSESKAIFKYCEIKENTALKNGVILLLTISSLEVYNTEFTKNIAYEKGGAIFIDQSSVISLKNSQFIENKAFRGSCIFAQHSLSESKITNCTFSYNSANYSGSLSLLESNFTLTDCTFNDNTADHYPAVEILYYSYAKIISCNFANHIGVGANIGVEDESSVYITFSNFLSSSSPLCCSVFKVINSFLYCDYCNIADSVTDGYSAIYCEKS